MTRSFPTLGVVASLVYLCAAAEPARAEPKQGMATMSEEAKAPPPKVPPPADFANTSGFSDAVLSPFNGVMTNDELTSLATLSRGLFQAKSIDALRDLAATAGAIKKRNQQFEEDFHEDDDVLFTYAIPHDPTLMLGMGKSRDGKVTALPRLMSGALDKPIPQPNRGVKAVPEGKGDGPGDLETQEETPTFENFLLRSPEQVCTAGISYSLNPDGESFSGLEYMPPPLPVDDPLMRILMFIESNPSPVTVSAGMIPRPAEEGAQKGDKEASDDAPAKERAGGEDLDAMDLHDREFPGALGAVIKRLDANANVDVPLAEFARAVQGREKAASPATFAGAGSGDSLDPVARLGRALATLAASIGAERKQCLEAGRRWREVHAAKGGGARQAFELFSCLDGEGKPIGLSARVASEDFPYVAALSLTMRHATTDLAATAIVDTGEMRLDLKAQKGASDFGPDLIFDAAGKPLALDFKSPDAAKTKGGEYDVYEWHENGRLKMMGHRKDGIAYGDERSYYANGALAGHVTFASGGKLTSYREWYENRYPAEETFFDPNGEMHGIRRWWHLSGKQAGEMTYANGRPDGDLTMWYDSGKMGVKAHYAKARLDGDVRWYYEDGGTLFEGRFKDEKPDGVVRLTLANGVVVSERTFKNGDPEGTWTTYDAKGRAAQEFSFKKGQKDGKSVMKYPEGDIAVEMLWTDGKVEGTVTSYYRGGQVAATCNFDHDKLAAFQRFHKTGQISMDGKISDSEKGVGQFSTTRVNGTTILSCALEEWEAKRCRLFNDKGRELRLPTYKELVGTIRPTPRFDEEGKPTGKPMTWRPEKCGGYEMKMNFDPMIDYGQEMISVDISTKRGCTDSGLAEVVYCSMTVDKGHLKVEPCTLAGGDSDEEEFDAGPVAPNDDGSGAAD